MKKYITTLVFGAIFMVSTMFAQTQTSQVRDPRNVAAAFAKQGKETSYRGDRYYTVVVDNDNGTSSASQVSYSYKALATENGDIGGITEITKGNVTAVFDPPLTTLPYESKGKITQMWCYAYGYGDKSPYSISGAEVYKSVLERGEPINLELKPNNVSVSVPVEGLTREQQNDAVLKLPDGREGYYWDGAFHVWIDPVTDRNLSYEIVSKSTGKLIEGIKATGTLSPFVPAVADDGNALGTTREAGTRLTKVNPNSQYEWFGNQKFQTRVDWAPGYNLPCSVWYTDDLQGGNLEVHAYSFKDEATIVVYEVLADGGLNKVAVNLKDDGNWNGYIATTAGTYRKLVIMVIGFDGADVDPKDPYQNGFNVQFHWLPPLQPDYNSGGGGKGVAVR